MLKKRISVIIGAAAVIAAVSMLSGCGEEPVVDAAAEVTEASAETEVTEAAEVQAEIDPAAVVDEIMTETAMTSMAEVTEDRLGNYVEVDTEKVESYSMYICGSGAFADEAAVFVMSSEDDTEALMGALQNRVDARLADYKDYKPEECGKLESAVIKSNGKYVLYAVSSDNDRAEEIFDSKF
ncbi:MAG: DUF4358 domain-containing protein [Oscillospiraceae bacterium]